MCARVGCETTHFTARSKQKEKVVVFVMCIWDAQRERSNGGGATRFEFLNFFEFSHNILKKVPKDTVRVGDVMVYPDARRMLQYNITVLFLSAKRGWNWFSASVSSSSFTSFLQ